MKGFLFICLTAAILHQTSIAQTSFKISSYNSTPEAFKYLLYSNKEIAANDTINEKIIDLVNPMLLDSVVERRKQHHRLFFVGWLIHAFGGYNWRAVNMHKQKTVGTAEHHGRSGKVEFSEYDIKFHLRFHLRKYLNQICVSCDLQKKYHRQDIRPSHRTDYSKEPFVRNPDNINASLYDLGTELTPVHSFIPQLNYLFFPTLPAGGGLKEHPNFGTAHPSMGFYGVNCLDCNHNCHPEMHPYEWVWWLKALEDDQSTDKTWLIGLFHEGSNRFKNWSKNPMTGEIAIPFAYVVDDLAESDDVNPLYKINVEHLVFNRFVDEGFQDLSVPDFAFSSIDSDPFWLEDDKGGTYYVEVAFNHRVQTKSLKYWFSGLNLDRQEHILSGYFHFATSVQDLYTTKITFTENYNNKP